MVINRFVGLCKSNARYCPTEILPPTVVLSAHVKRFSVSRTRDFHWLGPLGRVSHRVTMFECCVLSPPNAIYFEALIGPQITWSVDCPRVGWQVTGDWWQVTGDTWHVTGKIWHMTCYIFLLLFFAPFFCTFLVSMLLSAHVERFNVSYMQDFWCYVRNKNLRFPKIRLSICQFK